jgi:hypothetical protein
MGLQSAIDLQNTESTAKRRLIIACTLLPLTAYAAFSGAYNAVNGTALAIPTAFLSSNNNPPHPLKTF